MVSFPISTILPGKAEFQVGCVSGGYGDATKIEIPVYPPPTSEAFSVFGQLGEVLKPKTFSYFFQFKSIQFKTGEAFVQSIKQPENVIPGFGNVMLSTSCSQLQYLTDSCLYNWIYPYGCNEQLSSKLLTAVSLQDVLDTFKNTSLPKKSEVSKFVSKSLRTLSDRQRKDGSFGMWEPDNSTENTYISAYVGLAVSVCQEKGYSIPGTLIFSWVKKLEKYLEKCEQSLNSHLQNTDLQISLTAFSMVKTKHYLRFFC